jgi:hypothetical protein
VLDQNNTVEQRKVTIGPRIGDLRVIESGLLPDRLAAQRAESMRSGCPTVHDDSSAASRRGGSHGRGPNFGCGAFDDCREEDGDGHCSGKSDDREHELNHDGPPSLQGIRGGEELSRIAVLALDLFLPAVFGIGRYLNAAFSPFE